MNERSRKILIVLHQETSTPGRVGHVLVDNGFALDVRRPRFGDPLPETMDDHAGAVIFGGPMSANDPDEFIAREIDWTAVPLRERAPFLGICLGAQMLARQLGGTVAPCDQDSAEIGYYRIHPTEDGRRMIEWPERVYQWHREWFTLPSGATLLASGEDNKAQAFRSEATGFGIQFHPEVTTWMMNRWTVHAAHRLVLPGAQARKEHFEGRRLWDGDVKRWLHDFLDLWLASDRRAPSRLAAE
ncbi:MAG: glutamine amidotransferase [Pseudomonadota bacterium]